MPRRIYTTAPESYDGFGTVTVREQVGTTHGQAVRLVEVQDGYDGWQLARYGSGLHLAVSEEEWAKLVAYGLAEGPQ